MTIDRPALHDRGEKVLWWGQPDPKKYAFRKGLGSFLFGIPFFGFAVFWTYMTTGGIFGAFGSGIFGAFGGILAVFGIPFLVAGLGMLLSPLWYYVRGMRATYALTESRAVIDIAGFMPRRISVPLSQIQFIDVRESSDGSGDVYFKETVTSTSDGTSVRREGFVAVDDAQKVEQLLRDAVDANNRSAKS